MSDTSERTEQPTEQHLKKVRREGKLGRSQDLATWLGIAAAAVMLPTVISRGTDAAVHQLFTVVTIAQNPDAQTAEDALGTALASVLPTIGFILAAVVIAIIAASVLQGGLRIRPFKLHTEHFDLAKGIRRIFGGHGLWNGAKTLLKAVVVGLALWAVIASVVPKLENAGVHPISQLTQAASGAISALLGIAVAAGLVVAGLDVMMVIRRNRRMSMMTKREVKDEHKNTEGDPLVRQHRRSRMLAVSRNRMLSAVGESSVVLVNPTHYAVALKYEPGTSAPRVAAKGSGHVATRIREEATRSGIPMVRDVPLTRALHATVPLGGEIPPEYYTVIAQVLTFVALLKKRGSATGIRDNPTPFADSSWTERDATPHPTRKPRGTRPGRSTRGAPTP